MESPQIIAVILLIAFGLFAGRRIARNSEKRQKLPAGSVASLAHYLSCALMITVAPTVLTMVLILHSGVLNAIAAAIIMLGLAYLLLIPYAIAEAARPKQQPDRGWTAEDAKKSGL